MKTRLFIVLGMILVALGLTMSAAAQDADPACSVSDVLNTEYQGMVQRDWLQMVITTLNANIEDDDAANFLGTARELREVLSRLDADCRGLHFTSDDEGMKAVIGPVTFPDGTWKIAMEQDGMIATVKLTDLAGTCYDFISNVLTVSGDTAGNPAEVVVKLKGCEALIEVESVGGKAWDLIFEPIKLDE